MTEGRTNGIETSDWLYFLEDSFGNLDYISFSDED